MKAEITIKEGNKRPVNPLIFGHFIEYMRDCIDEGMWAQLLKTGVLKYRARKRRSP